MYRGWIKLYRCLLDDPVWQCSTPPQKVILVTLLLMANHTEKKWQWQGQPYICRPGQMITSLASIQQHCGRDITDHQIRHAITRFAKMGFLVNKSTKQGRLITICNWETYQNGDSSPRSHPANIIPDVCQDRPRIVTTNKNDKNIKHEKKDPPARPVPLSFEQQDIRQAQTANAHALAAFMEQQ